MVVNPAVHHFLSNARFFWKKSGAPPDLLVRILRRNSSLKHDWYLLFKTDLHNQDSGRVHLFAVGFNTQEPACAGEPWGGKKGIKPRLQFPINCTGSAKKNPATGGVFLCGQA
jgi:hypothetical protein